MYFSMDVCFLLSNWKTINFKFKWKYSWTRIYASSLMLLFLASSLLCVRHFSIPEPAAVSKRYSSSIMWGKNWCCVAGGFWSGIWSGLDGQARLCIVVTLWVVHGAAWLVGLCMGGAWWWCWCILSVRCLKNKND